MVKYKCEYNYNLKQTGNINLNYFVQRVGHGAMGENFYVINYIIHFNKKRSNKRKQASDYFISCGATLYTPL